MTAARLLADHPHRWAFWIGCLAASGFAACTKAAGLVAQLLGLLALAPALFVGAWAALVLVLVPVLAGLALVARFGVETRGRDLREFEPAPAQRP